MAAKKKRAIKTKRKAPKPALTFEEWKAKAAAHALEILEIDECFDEADSYDLAKLAVEAFKAGTSPGDFIEDVFGEDIARREYDDHLLEESLAEEFEDGEDE